MNKVALSTVVAVFSVVVWMGAASKPGDAPKPDLTLRANPAIALAPARITVTAHVKGGPNDNADLYCPTVEWDWGDGTVSESSSDCDPYEPSKSEIQRTYITQHVYKFGGNFVVQLRLKKQNKVMATANAQLNVGNALTEGGDSIR